MYAIPSHAARFRSLTLPRIPLPMGEVMIVMVVVLIAMIGG
jgi:hypothetical protein